jgi:hypothetical protein
LPSNLRRAVGFGFRPRIFWRPFRTGRGGFRAALCVLVLIIIDNLSALFYSSYMVLNPSVDALIFQCVRHPQQPRLVTLCAWCPDAAEQTAQARRIGAVISHGICPACLRQVDAELARA